MGKSEFDELLTILGTGKWNIMYFLVPSYLYFFIPSYVFSGVYLAPNVKYTCQPPDVFNVANISDDSCSFNYYNNETDPDGEMLTEKCTSWSYDTSIYTSTLTSEFNLVCDRGHLRATFQSMSSFASLFCSALVGYLADRFGRKIVSAVNVVAYAFICIVITFATNFNLILAMRFLQGCASNSTLYVLALEVCEVKYRSLVGILTALPWALGTMAWGAIAYLIRDWRYLQLTISLPYLLLFPVFYFMDESPRWLILKGYNEQALQVLKKAAKWNNSVIPSDSELEKMFLEIQDEKAKQELGAKSHGTIMIRGRFLKLPRLISTPKIRLLMALLTINLFISSLVFCGLTLNGSSYSNDPFLYMVISGLMEVPSYTLTAPLINWAGRKKPTVIGYFICGLSILALTFIPKDISWLRFALAMLGKLSGSASFMIVFVYMSELLPTEVRLLGTGTTMVFVSAGGLVAPYITDYLGPTIPWFPSVIFGLSSFVAGLVILPLPETLGRPMLESVDDLDIAHEKSSK